MHRESLKHVNTATSGLPLVEPHQVCAACGAQGTVGKVVVEPHNDLPQTIQRYCLNCWPIESARHRVLWKERLNNRTELQYIPNDSPRDEPGCSAGETTRSSHQYSAFSRVGPRRVVAFESATWHHIEDAVERYSELMDMVRSGTVPSLEALDAGAREMANEILAAVETRVGRMPGLVSGFLTDYGPDGDVPPPSSHANSSERESHSAHSLHDAVAAAHASADAVIAAFDHELESLSVPTTDEERARVEQELVAMLEQLQVEMESLRTKIATDDKSIEVAGKSGNYYLLEKLGRDREEQWQQLMGVRETVEDLEQLRAKLMGGVPPVGG